MAHVCIHCILSLVSLVFFSLSPFVSLCAVCGSQIMLHWLVSPTHHVSQAVTHTLCFKDWLVPHILFHRLVSPIHHASQAG